MDTVDLQNRAITEAILRKVVKKMDYRSQAVLSLCSHYGKDAYSTHGADLRFVRGFCDGASIDVCVGPNRSQMFYITDIFRPSICPEDLKIGDQIAVVNGREAAAMRIDEVDQGIMSNGDGKPAPKIILRRPRESEMITITCEYPLELDGDHTNFGFIFYEYAVIRNRFLLALVAQDGPAARAGLREGDEVVLINGHQPIPHLHATKVLLAMEPVLRLTVKRSGF